MRWEDVLKRDDIIGGDIEVQQDDYIYRGPINSIRIENGKVYIELSWVARMSLSLGESWKAWHITCFVFSTSVLPTDMGDDRVSLGMSHRGYGIIFPKGGSKLDPAGVKGLSQDLTN